MTDGVVCSGVLPLDEVDETIISVSELRSVLEKGLEWELEADVLDFDEDEAAVEAADRDFLIAVPAAVAFVSMALVLILSRRLEAGMPPGRC